MGLIVQKVQQFFRPDFQTNASGEFTPAETFRFHLRNSILSSYETLDAYRIGIDRFARRHPDVVLGVAALPLVAVAVTASAPAWVAGGLLAAGAGAACVPEADDTDMPTLGRPGGGSTGGKNPGDVEIPKDFEPKNDCTVPSMGEIPQPLFRRVNGGLNQRTSVAQGSIMGSFGPSGCAFDFENDGDIDVYTVAARSNESDGLFYLNNGAAQFQLQNNAPKPPRLGPGCLPFDYDGDGFTDLLVTGHHPKLFQNQQGTSWLDVTVPMGLDAATCLSYSAAACDLDGDENLDLAVGCQFNDKFSYAERTYLFIHKDGRFVEEGVLRGLTEGFFDGATMTFAINCLDINGDGHMDLYDGTDGWNFMQNRLWINDGMGYFEDQGALFGLSRWNYEMSEDQTMTSGSDTMGHGVADFALNHQTGFVVSDYPPRRVVNVVLASMRSNGQMGYAEIGMEGGITDRNMTGWGVMDIDADNDGDPDFAVATGGTNDLEGKGFALETPNPLYLNQGNRRFVRYQPGTGDPLGEAEMSYGTLVADLDGDYRQDIIFIHQNAQPTLLLNDGAPGNAAKLELQCPPPNVHCLGAKVLVNLPNNCSRLEQKIAGKGYATGVEGPMFFGMGEMTETGATVLFPNGSTQEVTLRAGETTIVSP